MSWDESILKIFSLCRVGRTARIGGKGNALLFVTVFQEKTLVELLEDKKIPIGRVESVFFSIGRL